MRYQTLAVIACVCLAGCMGAETSSTVSAPAESSSATLPSEPAQSTAPPANPAEEMASKFAGQITGAPSALPAQPTEQVVAEAGVGKKGQSLEGESGVLVTPVKALFKVEQKLLFNQITQAMNFYKATNGNFPKSQEDFDTHIVKANNLKLPELPAGQKYVYDPQRGELMVERPR